MDLTINDSEITEAIADYVKKQGIDLANKDLSISFTAGRGSNAKNSATIEITPVPPEINQEDPNSNLDADPEPVKTTKAPDTDDAETEEVKEEEGDDTNLFTS